jgi:5-deoxy-D-glucuronate isomerase
MSGFVIFDNSPLHWMSKRQKITVRNSAKAEIYATDQCVKEILRIKHIFNDMDVKHLYMPTNEPIQVYNNNAACVSWSKSMTTKGLRHITIKENATKESIGNRTISIHQVTGNINIADIFTKEMKDVTHFIELRDMLVVSLPT